MIRIVFFGTPAFSVPFLDILSSDKEIEIAAVVTQPDKPAGRGKRIVPPPVKSWAEEHGLRMLQPTTLRSSEVVEIFKKLKTDFFVVVAYGKMIPKTVLDIPDKGCLNVHPSLLPKYRGPSPMVSPILNGDAETGISIMLLDEGMDTGPVLAQKTIRLDLEETGVSLSKKIETMGPKFLLQTIKDFVQEKINPQPQDEHVSSVTKLLEREDGHITWQEPAESIERKNRAFHPWPGVWTVWKRERHPLRLKLLKLKIDKRAPSLPSGKAFVNKNSLRVGTSSHPIEILEIQPEGSAPMDTATFLRGYSDMNGATLG